MLKWLTVNLYTNLKFYFSLVYEILHEHPICPEVFNESVATNLNFGFLGINKIFRDCPTLDFDPLTVTNVEAIMMINKEISGTTSKNTYIAQNAQTS